MKKFKMIFVTTALLFVTFGVVAGKAKFASYTLWYDNTGTGSYIQITDNFTNLTNLDVSGSNVVSIVGAASKPLYVSMNGGGKQRVKTSSF